MAANKRGICQDLWPSALQGHSYGTGIREKSISNFSPKIFISWKIDKSTSNWSLITFWTSFVVQ